MNVKGETVQCGWSILLDSYISNKRNLYSCELLAVSALYIAIRMVSDKGQFRSRWWGVFSISY